MASLEAPRRITELDAVNIILQNAGEAPVTSFGPNSKPSAQKATELLAEESVRLQSTGYNFCTARRMVLKPSLTGEINLPATLLSFQPIEQSAEMDLQEDEYRLFDAYNGTHKFDTEVVIEAVLAKPFNSLPQPARWMIALSAALRFQNSENPGAPGLRVTASDVSTANADLERYDRRLRKGGLKKVNPHFRRMRGNR